MEKRVDVELHHAVHDPDRTSDKPDPGCLSHCFEYDAEVIAWVSIVTLRICHGSVKWVARGCYAWCFTLAIAHISRSGERFATENIQHHQAGRSA
jgi:hypothetical protein